MNGYSLHIGWFYSGTTSEEWAYKIIIMYQILTRNIGVKQTIK